MQNTPARMDKRSIDFSKMEEQFGDEKVVPFSFSTNPEDVQINQVSCFLTYTNEKTHEIIRNNLDRSPIYAGIIEGTGPRYCPSIEDKVVKFSDKERHQVFIEPEGLHTNEMYVGGMSSSLPEDVQTAMYRTVPGLENCEIVRNAYAIEYDCINARQLYPTLRFKDIEGLYDRLLCLDAAEPSPIVLPVRRIKASSRLTSLILISPGRAAASSAARARSSKYSVLSPLSLLNSTAYLYTRQCLKTENKPGVLAGGSL